MQVPSTQPAVIVKFGNSELTELIVNDMNQGIERLAEMDSQDKSKPNSDEAKERRPKWMIPLIAVVVVSVLALAGVFAWRAYEHRQHDSALSSCSQAVSNLHGLTRPSQLARYHEAVAVRADQVKDVKTIKTMNRSVKAVGSLRPQTLQCKTSMSTESLEATANKFKKLDAGYHAVYKAANAVLASRDAKTLDDAKAALSGKINEAKKLLQDSDGKVADNTARDNLQKVIDQAGQVTGGEIKAYQDAVSALQVATDRVNASMQAKSQADQQTAAQAQRQSRPTSSNNGRRGSVQSRRPASRPSGNRGGGGGGSSQAPTAPSSPQRGDGNGTGGHAVLPPLDTTHHGCNPDGSCGIG
ncbi:hypothetical protein H3V02_03550 [Bifidobacterium sp. W8106]|uniref:hypothetical protein n=1 Tax=Bifidobacterium TaxID=1678 RepID=UPI0018DBDF1A|nr:MULTISPECIES: hypothetical protein [Bifidobacterium]MBI0142253.1 hypothetical protein [Bifidobacterium choladohabitans]MBI0146729.1 hypothetical protein [Bifidobacterium sp. W8104]